MFWLRMALESVVGNHDEILCQIKMRRDSSYSLSRKYVFFSFILTIVTQILEKHVQSRLSAVK
jgi:hypothetical protein